MITITKSGDSAVKFEFTNSQHYLTGNGEIEVPINSLSLVIDDSNMFTFKKIDGDVFVSATYGELGMSKEELEEWYKENMVGETGGGGIDSGTVQSMIDESISGKVDTSTFSGYSASTDARLTEDEEVTAAGLNALNDALSGKQDKLIAGNGISIDSANTISVTGGSIDSGAVQTMIDESISGKADSSAVTPTYEVTQAEYDALVSAGTVDSNAYYIITDATPIDLSGYVATSAITTAVTSGSTDSEIPTAKAVFDAIPTGGTGGSYSAGTNISIDSANTISCTLPISGINDNHSITGLGNLYETQNNSTGYYNLLLGYGNKLLNNRNYNYIFGINNEGGGSVSALNKCQFIAGMGNICKNNYESAFGYFNKNVTDLTTGTLFSVGNGTASNARHNAFEIRKNGDIYFNDGTNDVKLQQKFADIDTTIGNINTILSSI